MCGIIAILKNGTEPEIIQSLKKISHRGIRDTLYKNGPGRYIGHRRLPINGLSRAFDHPLYIKETATWMVGEVYDYDRSRYGSDIEYIAYELKKESIPQFEGMFHIFHITGDNILTILSDNLFKKPLYFRKDRMAFCSEIKGLTHLGPNTLNKEFFDKFKSGIMEAPPPYMTPYNEIVRILNHIIQINLNTLEIIYTGQYLSNKYKPDPVVDNITLDSLIYSGLNDPLKRAIELRASADVPIGMLCSGGLDSSLLYCMLKRLYDKPFPVFHVENGEKPYVDLLNIKDLTYLKQNPAEDNLKDILYYNESPLDLGSMIPQYRLSKAIKEKAPELNVIITGDGADELFAGYKRAQIADTRMYDIYTELRAWHLPRLDKMGMSETLEIRSPFLDENIVKIAMGMGWPEIRGKAILKVIAKMWGVPYEIINREKKPLKSNNVIRDKMDWNNHLSIKFKNYFGEGLYI